MKYAIKIILVFTLVSPVICFSQTAEELFPAHRHEFGIDVTRLIRQASMLTYDYYPVYSDPYGLNQVAVNFRHHFGKDFKFSLRIGAGGMYAASDNEQPYGAGSDLKSSNASADFHIGLQRNIQLAKRWAIAPGIDFISAFRNNYYYSFNPNYGKYEISAQSLKAGGGFFLHTLFRLHERISISTEMAMYLSSTNTTIDTEYNYPGSTPVHDKQKQINAEFIPPMFISLNFHF